MSTNTIDQATEDQRFRRNAMNTFIEIGAMLLIIVYCLQIMAPFIGLLLWSLIIAVGVYPLHQTLSSLLGGREKSSAIIIVLIGLSILVVPVAITADSSIAAVRSVSSEIRASGGVSIPPPAPTVVDWPVIGSRVHELWAGAAENLQATLDQFRPQLVAAGEWLVRAVGSGLLSAIQFAVAMIIAGVFLVSADAGYRTSCLFAAAIAGDRGKELTDMSIATIRSVAKGVLGVAIIQALMAAIGLVAIGVPAAGIWAGAVLILAVIQLPTILVLGPIAVWVFSVNDVVPATIFAVYVVIIGLVDNILKPLLLGRGVDVPMLVILLGAIGGAIHSGIIGLFVGAVILALAYQLLMAWMTNNASVETDAAAAESG